MLNRVVLVGRLTRDPELRYTPSGVAVANFTVAANRPFKNQQGEQEADFIRCVAWRHQAENLANYMRKGSLIGVDGRIQTSSFEGQDGKMVYMTEVLAESIQFLEPRSGGSQQRNQSGGYQQNDPYQHQAPAQQQYAAPQQQQQSSQQFQQAPPAQQQANTPLESDGERIDIADDDLPF